jgi:hypothetical protein
MESDCYGRLRTVHIFGMRQIGPNSRGPVHRHKIRASPKAVRVRNSTHGAQDRGALTRKGIGIPKYP